MSEVYRGRSKVKNDTPRSVAKPPPWANLDPRVLSPIPNKKKREARWDKHFAFGSGLQREVTPSSVEAPGTSRSRRLTTTAIRRRPASAGVRGGHNNSIHLHGEAAPTCRSWGSRPVSATVRGRETPNWDGSDTAGSSTGRLNKAICPTAASPGGGVTNRGSSRQLSMEERDVLDAEYVLDEEQKTVVGSFVDMLTSFDTCSMISIIEDTFREAQSATGLHDFTGCGDD